MGNPRRKPERLGEKLRQIRLTLDISQSEMLRRLEAEDFITYHQISGYESGNREPPLQILLQYARVAGICMEVLVDDELELPAKIPKSPKHSYR
ncbi:MAG TPA: helix-turn-helix transcriptional regulator [Pyrinomonadaceae bacterium]|nr:helix-turn-helix transcriptional regulator [Pyrinomonadaceae bacterium]